MSLSRSPSPIPGGGWSSPGLNISSSGRSSPASSNRHHSPSGGSTPVMWESARTRNGTAGGGRPGYPSFSTQGNGFLSRHMRKLSSSLPSFVSSVGGRQTPAHYIEKDKNVPPGGASQWLGGRSIPLAGRLRLLAARMGRKTKIRLLLCLLVLMAIYLFFQSRKSSAQCAVRSWQAHVRFSDRPPGTLQLSSTTGGERRGWAAGKNS